MTRTLQRLFHLRPVGAALLLVVLGLLLQGCNTSPQGISVGAEAPAFSLPAADGRTVSLSDYAGQPVLLYFHMAIG